MKKLLLALAMLVGLAATLALAAAPAQAQAASSMSASESFAGVDGSMANSRSSFDRAYLNRTARYVITDMRTINEYLEDGIAVPSAFYLLSDSYGYMLHAGVPPKIKYKAKYLARISTLSDFAEFAGDEYYDEPTQALARYSVIRTQTRILFADINRAIGTDFTVPQP